MNKEIEIPDTLVIRLVDINDPIDSNACCINHEKFDNCEDCILAYRALNRFRNNQDQWDKGFHAGYNMINKFVKHLQETIEVLRKRKHYWRSKYHRLLNYGLKEQPRLSTTDIRMLREMLCVKEDCAHGACHYWRNIIELKNE